jgi:release factor glutamine methyltransferase
MTTSAELIGGTDLPRHEAVRLLVAATNRSRLDLHFSGDLGPDEVDRFRTLVDRRRAGEPLQYLEGDTVFGPATLNVDPRVLIPRPETEEMLELAAELVPRPHVIVDLCTGSGNLAVALAMIHPGARVVATDISPDAIDVARANAARNEVDVELLVGDLFEPLPPELRTRIDLLVANPPYLAEHELAHVPDDVAREPTGALVGGPRGDEVVARIGATAVDWLVPGGVVVCEISEFDAERSVGHFASLDGVVHRDLFGKDRFVVGRRRFE